MDISPTINSVHGRIFSYIGADPDANTEISITVPARRRWRLISALWQLVTAVAEADRTVAMAIGDGSVNLFRLSSDTVQIASQTRWYNYSLLPTPQFLAGEDFHMPLPPFILMAGWTIDTITTNLQAADNYGTPRLLIEEWIDP